VPDRFDIVNVSLTAAIVTDSERLADESSDYSFRYIRAQRCAVTVASRRTAGSDVRSLAGSSGP